MGRGNSGSSLRSMQICKDIWYWMGDCHSDRDLVMFRWKFFESIIQFAH